MAQTEGGDERTYGQWWDSTEDRVRVPIAEIHRVGIAALRAVGASEEDAELLLSVNLDKSIQGDHARGVGKLPGLLDRIRTGRTDLDAKIEVLQDRPASAVVDAGPTGDGRLLTRFAVNLAIEKARACGVGFVAMRGTGSILTQFVHMATDAGMIGLIMVQSGPGVAPLGGYEKLFGNAPIAIGIPAGRHDPLIIDMSLTQTSASGVMMAAAQGQHVPEGFLLDADGNPTTDARDFMPPIPTVQFGSVAPTGTLVPLGGGHKGYALIYAVGLLTSLLPFTEPPWQLERGSQGEGRFGSFVLVVDPAAFRPDGLDGALTFVDDFMDTVKAAPRREGVDEILYPGEKSQALRRARRAEGSIRIPRSDYDALVEMAAGAGVPGPQVVIP